MAEKQQKTLPTIKIPPLLSETVKKQEQEIKSLKARLNMAETQQERNKRIYIGFDNDASIIAYDVWGEGANDRTKIADLKFKDINIDIIGTSLSALYDSFHTDGMYEKLEVELEVTMTLGDN